MPGSRPAAAPCGSRRKRSVLLGGNGILLENHIGRFVADAEAIYSSYEGTCEMNTLIVGKSITGPSAFV
jgi:glutaryl-CoA dehydrogenase